MKIGFPSVLRKLTVQGRTGTFVLFPAEGKMGVCGPDVDLGQAQLFAHHIGPLDQSHTLIEGDAAREPLTAEAAIRRDD